MPASRCEQCRAEPATHLIVFPSFVVSRYWKMYQLLRFEQAELFETVFASPPSEWRLNSMGLCSELFFCFNTEGPERDEYT